MTTTPIDTLPVLDLNEPGFWQDIYTPLAEAREASPVAMTTDGVLYVLRHDEVDTLLKDPRFLAADLLAMMGLDSGPVWSWWQSLMFSKNPPEHTRLRTLVSRAFTPRQIEKLRESIRVTAESLVAPALEDGIYQVMEQAAHLLPSTVMADMLGIPAADRSGFVDWTTDIGLAFGAATDPVVKARVEAALAGLDGYVRQMIEQRRSTPGDDLLSQLLAIEEGSDRLTTDELVGITENLMFAGHDTTRGSVGVVFQVLAERPDVHADLFANPDLVAGAVEELLRYEAITFSTSREASEDCEIAGVAVGKGTPVGVCLPAASRDPRRYDDPDRFDVTREDVRPPTFGAGVHFCLGAALARVELQELLSVVTQRSSAVELVDPPARWMPFAHIRRLEALPVRLTPR
jgi:cytochrome P450